MRTKSVFYACCFMFLTLHAVAKDKTARCTTLPTYTEAAKASRIEGTVGLVVTVSETGKVLDATVEQKLGYGLDKVALDWVKCSKFEPTMKDGKPVKVKVRMEVQFKWPDGIESKQVPHQ